MSGTWKRRAVTIPAVTFAFVLVTSSLPLLLLFAVLIDAVRSLTRRLPWVGTRLVLFGWFYLAGQVLGLAALFAVWLSSLVGGAERRQRLMRRTFAVQVRWAGALFRAVRTLFGLQVAVEGEDSLRGGPYVVFIRHASVIDTLLPTVLVTARHGIRLRFVLKRELLLDPCLDVAGLRLPNYFVDRTGDDPRDIAGVRQLGEHLGEEEGVLIYPEGTRFTLDKHRRALEKLATEAPDLFECAKGLTHVLPPRVGGALALLEAASEADVVFFAHVGLDGFASVGDIFRHALGARRIDVRLWRIPRAEIPRERAERISFLYREWHKVDAWVAGHMRQHIGGGEGGSGPDSNSPE